MIWKQHLYKVRATSNAELSNSIEKTFQGLSKVKYLLKNTLRYWSRFSPPHTSIFIPHS